MARLLSLYLNMIIYKIHTYVKNVLSIKIDYGPQCADEKFNKSVEDICSVHVHPPSSPSVDDIHG